MRLVCPNCGAHYEVDDRVIPETGRDVQCSACAHAWYQMPPNMETARGPLADEPDDADAIAADTVETAIDAEPRDKTGAEADIARILAASAAAPESHEDEPPFEAEPEIEDASGAEPEAAIQPASAVAEPPRRVLDDNLRAILQEEAEREIQARTAERSREPEAMETQPDLGLDAAPAAEDDRHRRAREREALHRAADAADDDTSGPGATLTAGAATAAGAGLAATPRESVKRQPRRELFPDIEEINSTLDGYGPGERMDDDDDEPGSRAGFGRAFLVVILIAVLALALYLFAPRLAESVPALEPLLTAYVGAINGLRAWLDATVQGLTGSIEGS